MQFRIRSIVIVLAGLLVLAACATSPTGRKQLMLVSEESAIANSRQAYLTTVRSLDEEGKIAHDTRVNARVKEITGRLIYQAIEMFPHTADWEWSVVVIDDPETVNAWCMAGGRMAIYTGLLQKIDPTDDELAQVMGHEIAHALANHTAEKMSVHMASSLGVAAVAVAADSSVALSGAALAAAYAVNMPNSRVAETEADQIGIELAAKAGYDPRAAQTLWAKMAGLSEARPPEWMSTHPDPENRQERLAKLEPKVMPYYKPEQGHPEYRL